MCKQLACRHSYTEAFVQAFVQALVHALVQALVQALVKVFVKAFALELVHALVQARVGAYAGCLRRFFGSAYVGYYAVSGHSSCGVIDDFRMKIWACAGKTMLRFSKFTSVREF